jgi:hypothetical protein
MPKLVVNGAMMQCSMGVAPGTLSVLPINMTDGDQQHIATIQDYKPMVNIGNFGMCQSMANPQVAAATSAAMGVLTPQPCIPMTTSPWTPGSSTTQIKSQPALTDNSQCMCTWAGQITITQPGQQTMDVDG